MVTKVGRGSLESNDDYRVDAGDIFESRAVTEKLVDVNNDVQRLRRNSYEDSWHSREATLTSQSGGSCGSWCARACRRSGLLSKKDKQGPKKTRRNSSYVL